MLSLSKADTKLNSRARRWLYLWTLVLLASLSFSTAIMEISCVAILLGWLFLRTRGEGLPPFERKMLFALLAYISLACISFFWSEYPKQSFRGILKVLKGLLVFFKLKGFIREFEDTEPLFCPY